MDGFIATNSGESKYISSKENLDHIHRLRAISDIIIVGANTFREDKPKLTTRLVEGDNPKIYEFDPKKIEYIIFSAGSEVAKKYVKKFLDANVSVIDMSSQFRYQPDVPLIIPEINIDELAKYQRPVLIANPNCSSAQLLLILKNIHTEINIS